MVVVVYRLSTGGIEMVAGVVLLAGGSLPSNSCCHHASLARWFLLLDLAQMMHDRLASCELRCADPLVLLLMLHLLGDSCGERSRSPTRVASRAVALPSPPLPRDVWWAHNCHCAQLRLALRTNMRGIVHAALDKRARWCEVVP